MKVIGITGGIGSGKSLVADTLRQKYNAYVINTDEIAKWQMEPGGISYTAVVNYFGRGILAEDSTIDKGKLSKIVFEEKEKLNILNSLTHPNVLKEVKERIEECKQQGNFSYVVVETALMIESGYASTCDSVWYVRASEQERRKRLIESRNYSMEKINAVFASQSKDEDFMRQFSNVIENTGDIVFLEQEIDKLIRNMQNV